MKPRFVTYRYSREFAHPAKDCYRWLTDYTDNDPKLAGDILREREVQERTAQRVVMRVNNELLGRAMRGRAEVILSPERLYYEARPLDGDGKGLLYTYQLTELGPRRTRLDVTYTHRAKKLRRYLQLLLARPVAMRKIDRMWAGFAAAMDRDLGSINA